MSTCTLLDRTIELLATSEKSVMQISRETSLSFYWLNNLLYAKKRVDPSVTKTVRLYEHLSNKKLDV